MGKQIWQKIFMCFFLFVGAYVTASGGREAHSLYEEDSKIYKDQYIDSKPTPPYGGDHCSDCEEGCSCETYCEGKEKRRHFQTWRRN